MNSTDRRRIAGLKSFGDRPQELSFISSDRDPFDFVERDLITRFERKRWSRAMNSARHENIGDSLAGCNMIMRRAVAERLGLFDENMGSGSRIGAGNDIDYVYRCL